MGVIVRKKWFVICIVLALSMIQTSCAKKMDDTDEGKFTFTEIDTGLLYAGTVPNSMTADKRIDSAYVLGVKKMNNSETSIRTINTQTLECSEFNPIILDKNQQMYAFFPYNDGYWVHTRDQSNGSSTLKLLSSDFEVLSTLDVDDWVEKALPDIEDYNYNIWGSTDEGHVVISQKEDTILSINAQGACIQTWDLFNRAEASDMRFHRASVYGNDIFCFSLGNNNTEIIKLLPDGSIEELFTLNATYSHCLVGNDGRIYMFKGVELYVLSESGDAEFLFEWSKIASPGMLYELVVLGEDTYLVLISNKVFFVTKGQEADEAEALSADKRTELTLACYGENAWLRQHVYSFNRDNEEYQIKIRDYKLYEDGAAMLNLDVLSGMAPDIIWWDFSLYNPFQSATYSNTGQLVDLYTLLDQDTEISRNTFLPNLLEAIQSNGGALFELPLEFLMSVAAGKTDVVGTRSGWTPDEFFELLEQYPGADVPFGSTEWADLLSMMIYNNSDMYIDWETGQCNFDSDEFIDLLEIAKIHSKGLEKNILPIKLVNEGRQLLTCNIFSDVSSIQKFTELFGGKVNFIGYPTSQGTGNTFVLSNSVSICVQSENIGACWQFIRGLATYEEQITGATLFPANYEALQERLNNPTKYEDAGAKLTYRDAEGDEWFVTFTDATPEESAIVRQIIESCDRVHREDRNVMTIIEEEAPAYFSGDKTVEEVARIIQSRVQTYVSEQKK